MHRAPVNVGFQDVGGCSLGSSDEQVTCPHNLHVLEVDQALPNKIPQPDQITHNPDPTARILQMGAVRWVVAAGTVYIAG